MTGFFEWLLTEDTNGMLRAEQQHGMGWFQIAQQAAPRLRERIMELARLRAISISLEDLLRIAEGHELRGIDIESKYGIRRLPIEGLFCDKPSEVWGNAQVWADQLLSQLLDEHGVASGYRHLTGAIDLANSVWQTYLNDDIMRDRLELGNLVQALEDRQKSAAVDAQRLRQLWERFSTRPYDEAYLTSTRPTLNKNVIDVRSGVASNLSRRWACLMLLVRLLQLRSAALRFVDVAGESLSEGDKRLLKTELQDYDIYLVWFPVSSSPVDLKKITSKAWAAVLTSDLNDTSRVGVSLNIDDLLHGRPWQIDTKGRETYGLKTGERELLRWYALSLTPQYPRSLWDPQAQRVLLGGA
ncbi:MAG TPA: hypothetical protein VGW39_14880 [Chthoniobacterales bacterium]|nr:hypothetical protein [Chthoniobacterales bacterium]